MSEWQHIGDAAERVVEQIADTRADRIDSAVAKAGELIGALLDLGPINPAQAKLIVEGVARAAVPNFEAWELRASAKRIEGELAAHDHSTGRVAAHVARAAENEPTR